MIRIQSIELRRGAKCLLEDASLTLNPGEKIGLIGVNGSGKSSLFSLLRGELHADAGEIDIPPTWRIAHVAQETPALARSALDYALDGDTRLRQLQADLAAAEAAHDGPRMAELHAALEDANAYTADARARMLLAGLGFTEAQMALPVAQFSGGWRMRLNLAQALLCPSELLLLDEPTNHLDLDTILWLEDWLRRYPGTLVIISHDRDFLDGVTTVSVHIDAGRLRRYGGNYSFFERQRAVNLSLTQAALDKQQRERAHLQSFIDRFKAKASKARQAQSRMKQLARMEEMAPIHAAASFSFEFAEPARAPSPLITLEAVDAGYPGEGANGADSAAHCILRGINLNLQPGQRIGLLGANGAGKSTLIKTLLGELAPLNGRVQPGRGLVIGYFAQQQLESLNPAQSPLWHLGQIAPEVRAQDLRDFLGGFNFSGDMATQAVAPLSGGEKARLALALIAWKRPNLLLLDEPTNHLDLDTREALSVALAQFEGTLILVSHDRHLLNASTDELILVGDGRVTPFDGDLDDYRDWLFAQRNAATRSTPAAASTTGGPSRQAQKRQEAEARQRAAAARKPLEAKIRKLEAEMAPLNQRKEALDALLSDPQTYADGTPVAPLVQEQASLQKTLDALEMAWLELQESLQDLEIGNGTTA